MASKTPFYDNNNFSKSNQKLIDLQNDDNKSNMIDLNDLPFYYFFCFFFRLNLTELIIAI